MKTKLLGLFLMTGGFCASSFAQITVNNTNVAAIGDLVKQAQDTMPAGTIVAGAPGTNLTWNFSALHNHKVDSLVFEVPGWPPYANPFPSSNLAVVQNGKFESFMINNSTGLVSLGAVGLLGTTQVRETNTPANMMAKWPSTYGTNFTNNYVTTAKFAYAGSGYDSIKLKYTYKGTSNVDAWGSMQTPLGTFASIRQYNKTSEIDSIWIHSTAAGSWVFAQRTPKGTISYSWWTNSASAGFPLVSLSTDSTSGKTTGSWLLATPASSGIVELGNQQGYTVYPNPASSSLQIRSVTNEGGTISVIDMTGRNVMNAELLINETTSLNTESLHNGMYFLIITSREGIRTTHKFCIVK
ncbi:MAG: T9SS type A sorting domain-containing protein [Bacteroidia bacterium]